MPRPFTRRQAIQNDRFLEILAQTGNIRLSGREAGLHYGTVQHRRGAHAEFAQRLTAALAAAHARFHLAGGKRGPEASPEPGRRRGRKGSEGARLDCGPGERTGLRTKGGEPVVVRTKHGTLQLRPAHPNKLTKQCEQAFLLALSSTANMRLSAAAAGASPAAFYRRRKRNPAFDREVRLALKMGYEALHWAMLTAGVEGSHEHDAWRYADPPPIPPMTPDQALQLLMLHEKSVRRGWEQSHRRRRRGEPWEVYTARLRTMWECERRQEGEEEARRRAERFEESGDWRHEEEAPPIPLPPLHLVTGWSRAKGGKPHNPKLALFGGWRIEEMKAAHRSGTSMGARKMRKGRG
ncbi:MAG TPA: hypothetical protein VNT25_07550 [Allosphingosinicella sp.]|nr:hypothetical protein [Allosphingosinicella sp.]